MINRDTREMLELSGFLTFLLIPVFGAVVVTAIIVEALIRSIF